MFIERKTNYSGKKRENFSSCSAENGRDVLMAIETILLHLFHVFLGVFEVTVYIVVDLQQK